MTKADMIYALMTGDWDTKNYPVPEMAIVKDEFAPGELCDVCYDRVYHAEHRLYERLGSEEDADVETIVGEMNAIGRHLAMKMFYYGENWDKLCNGQA